MSDFLPPVVAKLGADISEFAEKFAEATAIVQSFKDSVPAELAETAAPAGAEGDAAGKAYSDGLANRLKGVGDQVGREFSDEFSDSVKGVGDRVTVDVSGRLRDARGRFVSAGQSLGHDFTNSFENETKTGFAQALRNSVSLSDFKDLGSGLAENFTSVGAAALAAVSPLIAAGIGGAIISGVGAGVIGAGAVILHNSAPIVSATTQLKNDVTSIFKDAASPLQGPFVDALHMLDSTAKSLAPQFKEMFAAMAPAVAPLTKGITGLITNAMPGLVQVAKAAAPFLTQLAKYMPGLGQDISAFLSTVAKNAPVSLHIFESLLGIFEGVLGVMNVLLNIAGKLYAVFTAVENFVDKIPPAVSKAASAVGRFFADLGSKVAGAVTTAWSKVSGFFSQVGSAVGNFVSGAGAKIGDFFTQTIPGWVETTGGALKALPGKILAALTSLPGKLHQVGGQMMHQFAYDIGYGLGLGVREFLRFPGQVRAAVTHLFTTLTQLGRQGVNAFVGFFEQLPGRVAALWSQLYNQATTLVSQMWTTVKNATVNGITAVVQWVQQIPGKILSIFTQAKSNATTTTSNMVDEVLGYVRTLPGKVLNQLNTLAGDVKRAFADAGKWLYNAGQDIIRGLINGVTSMFSWAYHQMTGFASDMVHGFKSALGIRSPSTVFAEIGSHVVGGFVQGVNGNASAAAAAVADMLRFGTSTTLEGLGGLGSLGAGVTAVPGATTPVAAAQTMTINLVNQLTLLIDGKQLHASLIAPAQQYKLRTGTTGLT